MTPPVTADPASTAAASRPAAARIPRRVGGPKHWWDWVLAADPGLGATQAGWRTLTSTAAGVAAGYGIAPVVGVPVILGLIFGGIIALLGALCIAENTVRRLTITSLWMPIPFVAGLTLAAWLRPHQTLVLCLLGVAVALRFYLPRFRPPFGLLTSLLLFVGLVVGHTVGLPLAECARALAVAAVTAGVVLAGRLLFGYPTPREDLLRTQRAFLIEARRVADAAATALAPKPNRKAAIRRMRRALRRLDITTLTIDGHLDRPEVAADADTAELLHQYLFDAELALQGTGQAVEQLANLPVPAPLREALVVALVIASGAHQGSSDTLHSSAEMVRQAASAGETEVRGPAPRVADLLDGFATALSSWLALGSNSPTDRARVPFRPTVALEGNRPAGTGPATQRAGRGDGSGWRRVIPYIRVPLQAGISAAIVVPSAYAINPHYFYWGLIGVIVGFIGSNTGPERLRRLGHRVAGIVVGGVIGIGLLQLIGPGHVCWTVAVIVVALAFAVWGIQFQYAYFVAGLIVALVQLYALSTPISGLDWLLAQRVFDDALGMAVAALCAAVIFPVSTRKVTQEANRMYLAALEQFVRQVAKRWQEPDAPVRLRGAARAVDAALLQVCSAMRPLVRVPLSVRQRSGDNVLALLATATRHADALAAAADVDIDLAPPLLAQVERIIDVLAGSLRVLAEQFGSGRQGAWVRVGPMIRELESSLRPPAGPRAEWLREALYELAAMDEALANLASSSGVAVVIPTADTPPQ